MNPAKNMALDKAILCGIAEGISPNTIRIYDWDPPTVSFGYHQKINEQINLKKICESDFGLVRRPTGGRAVLHFDEVTYAVIAENKGQFSGSILEVYKEIAKPLLKSLNDVGINAEITDSLTDNNKIMKWKDPCFSSSSKYEININGKKIIGSAQVRSNNAFLQHGSILLNHNQEKMADLLPISAENKRRIMKKFLAKKTVSINQLLDKNISFWKFAEILKKNFIKFFKIENYSSQSLLKKESIIYSDYLKELEKEIVRLRKNC